MLPKNEDNSKNENNPKSEDNLKNEDNNKFRACFFYKRNQTKGQSHILKQHAA